MISDSQTLFLSSYISHHEHPLTAAQRKLDDLVDKIEACKQSLKTAVLNGDQSLMARHLVASLDQGVDELAHQITTRLYNAGGPGENAVVFNEHIERLLTICKQLSGAMMPKGCCTQLA